MRRGIRGAIAVAVAAVFLIAGAGRAMAAQASPAAGGAQPVGQSWNDGVITALIVGVPVIITIVMWVILARKKSPATK